MPEQNKVLTNIPQSLSEEAKAQARENIGAPSVTDIPSEYSAVFKFDDVTEQWVLAPNLYMRLATASASAPVSFNSGITRPVAWVMMPQQADEGKFLRAHYNSHTNDTFFTWDTVDINSGRIAVFSVSNGVASVTGLYTNISNALANGSVPVIRYEVSSNPQQYGYYWLTSATQSSVVFARVSDSAVYTITVLSDDSVAYVTSSFSGFDMSVIAQEFSPTVSYPANTLVTHGGQLYRARYDWTAGAWDNDHNQWAQTSVADVLGRVRNASNGAVADPNASCTWIVPNNALSVIDCQVSPGPLTLTICVEVDLDEIPNFAVQLKSLSGGTLTVNILRGIPGSVTPIATAAWYSKTAGNVLPENKPVQITCVGNCWTWEEYVDPSAPALSNPLNANNPAVSTDPSEPV